MGCQDAAPLFMTELPVAPAPIEPAKASRAQRIKQRIIFALKLGVALGALYYVIVTKVIPNQKQIISIDGNSITLRDRNQKDTVINPDAQTTRVFVKGKPATLSKLEKEEWVLVETSHDKVLKIEVVSHDDLTKLAAMLTSPSVLLLAIAAFSVQLLIGAQRLRLLLSPQGVRIGYRTALRLTYLGAFFDTFMITSVGGDAVKAVYLARETPREQRVEAVSVLILDRLMGLIGLLTLALTVSCFEFRTLSEKLEPWMIKLMIVVPCLLLTGTAMLLSETVYMSRPMQLALRHLPMGAKLSRAYGSLQKFRDRPGVLFQTFLMSLVVHFFGVLTGYIFVLGGFLQATPGEFCVALLICNFVCSFAPFAGLGIGQTVYEPLFLMVAGMAQGWVLATVMQAAILLAKSPGFVAWLLSRETGGGHGGNGHGASEQSTAPVHLQPQLDSTPT